MQLKAVYISDRGDGVTWSTGDNDKAIDAMTIAEWVEMFNTLLDVMGYSEEIDIVEGEI
jgi:hypothetical protein